MVYGEKTRGGNSTTHFESLVPQASVPMPDTRLPTITNNSARPDRITKWNTTNLGLRLGVDGGSAAVASALVAPLICVIDRSIVQKAATGDSLTSCLTRSFRPAITHPIRFLSSSPFLIVFSLYFGTYATANIIDTLTNMVKAKSASSVTASSAKFVATSAVNMSLCIYKDARFAKWFGRPSSSPAANIPRLSYLLFAARDSLTIFASFNLPSIIAPQLANLPPSIKTRFSTILKTESGRANTAQFIAPAAMQLFSTPIHLLGLDLYNRQGALGFQERFTRISRDWLVSAFARMGRIVPAFGVGGVVNANFRRTAMQKLE